MSPSLYYEHQVSLSSTSDEGYDRSCVQMWKDDNENISPSEDFSRRICKIPVDFQEGIKISVSSI